MKCTTCTSIVGTGQAQLMETYSTTAKIQTSNYMWNITTSITM